MLPIILCLIISRYFLIIHYPRRASQAVFPNFSAHKNHTGERVNADALGHTPTRINLENGAGICIFKLK